MVPTRPPPRSSDSMTMTEMPSCRRRWAQERPEIPAPMMATWIGCVTIVARSECFREQRPAVHLLLSQGEIEHHACIAYEDAAERGDADFFVVETDEAVGAKIFELGDFGRKIFIEGDAELLLYFAFTDYGVAKEAANYFAAQPIVVGEAIAAHCGNAAARDGRGVG